LKTYLKETIIVKNYKIRRKMQNNIANEFEMSGDEKNPPNKTTTTKNNIMK